MKVTKLLRMIRSIPAMLGVLLIVALPRLGIAASSAWDTNEHVDTRLVSAAGAVGKKSGATGPGPVAESGEQGSLL